ncbi:hypothetical protein F4779DRAFT_221436 [Xylariaceae sp. FL0662B]|nr:hypothetical protein F4779DRAFT_221436 [Xylariaceae sp. FL0662B]
MKMQPAIISIGLGALSLASWTIGQRIRVDEPSEQSLADEATTESKVEYLPQNTTVDENGVSNVPQVDVSPPDDTAGEAEPIVPISALLFSGSPGPKDCRGNVIMNVGLPKPGSAHATPKCYNVPGVAQCATFAANKDDGCEARLFNEPNCLTFANLAVFTPEKITFGGLLRSIEITCGIEGVTPPPLNLPGMDLPPNAQQAVGK